jgi:hypothetical protein
MKSLGKKLHVLVIKEFECGRFVFAILGFAQIMNAQN